MEGSDRTGLRAGERGLAQRRSATGDARRLKGIARSIGVKETMVLRQWIVERLRGARGGSAPH